MNDLERFEAGYIPVTESGCWLWLKAVNGKGYGRVSYNGKNEKAHRLSYILNNGPIPDGLFVLHKCDIPSCVNPTHLFLGSNNDNMRDSVIKGRHAAKNYIGDKNPNAKLSEQDVLIIFGSDKSNKNLADEYNVSKTTISNIQNGTLWSHLQK